MNSRSQRIVAIVLAVIVIAPGALAQWSPEGGVVFELNYSDPGARSLALGGAFTALADDATAAFANPAGLTQLVNPEISMEARHRAFSTPYTHNGRIDGTASTGIGLDTVDGIALSTSHRNVTELSFLSLVYPSNRWSVALYRHQLISFEFEGRTQGLFGETDPCCGTRYADQITRVLFDVVGYGLSGAYRLNETLSFGVGVTVFDSSVVGQSALYAPQDPWGENSYLRDSWISSLDAIGSDTSVDLNAGVLWAPREWLHVGVFYRGAPQVDMTVAFDSDFFEVEQLATLRLPDVYGLGLAFRSHDGRFAAGVEWDRVEYSTIGDSVGLSEIVFDDGDELHAGMEYVFLNSAPVWSVRVGAWLDPNHLSRYVGTDVFEAAMHPAGDDEMHYSAGFGAVIAPFQIDVGFDLSDRVDTVSISAIYSF